MMQDISEMKSEKVSETVPESKTTRKTKKRKYVKKSIKTESKINENKKKMITTAEKSIKEPEPEDAKEFPFLGEEQTPEEQRELKKKSGIITTRDIDKRSPKIQKNAWRKKDECITTRDILGKGK